MALCPAALLHGAKLGCTSLLLATLAGHAFAALLNQAAELVTAQLHASGLTGHKLLCQPLPYSEFTEPEWSSLFLAPPPMTVPHPSSQSLIPMA